MSKVFSFFFFVCLLALNMSNVCENVRERKKHEYSLTINMFSSHTRTHSSAILFISRLLSISLFQRIGDFHYLMGRVKIVFDSSSR